MIHIATSNLLTLLYVSTETDIWCYYFYFLIDNHKAEKLVASNENQLLLT